MGHLINPTSFRLGVNKKYNFEWLSNYKNDYNYLVNEDQLIAFFLKDFFDNKLFMDQGIYFSHIKLFRNLTNETTIIIYLYDGLFLKSYSELSAIWRRR